MLYNLQIYESFDYCQHVTSNNMSHSSLYVFKGVNTLPPAYFVCFNLQWYYPYIPIQMQLSRKQKTFCRIFSAFLKFPLNFEQFEKKDDLHSLFIPEAPASVNCGSMNV